MVAERWTDPQWLGGAHAWIDEQLARLGLRRAGETEQAAVNPWSVVLRVPTGDGQVWFKASAESLRHEAALVGLLAARRPDAVPALLAADPDNGWTLTADAGECLRTVIQRERSLERWFEVLTMYAAVQLDLAGDVERMLALGVPDLRLATLPDRYDRLMDEIDAEPGLRASSGRVAELADELACYGLPELLQHDDLHDGQVFLQDGRPLLTDWGDACISHPFFTLSVTLEGVIARGLDDEDGSEDIAPYRDAYLAAFAARYDGDLVAAATTATRLGWAARAINGHIPGDDGPTRTRLRMFVDRLGSDRLGG